MLNIIVTLKRGWESLKVIEINAIRKLGCGFLFAVYSNYGRAVACAVEFANPFARRQHLLDVTTKPINRILLPPSCSNFASNVIT